MQIAIHGRQLEVTPALRAHAEKKLPRLDRYFPPEAVLDLELSVERNPRIAEPQIAEVTVHARGEVLRVRAASADMYAAIDLAIDRIRRKASDHHDRHTGGRPHHTEVPVAGTEASADDEPALVADE